VSEVARTVVGDRKALAVSVNGSSRIEVRAGEGGADAQAFVKELAEAISTYIGVPVVFDGTTAVLHRL
jgi:hypothetical protein